MVTQEQPEQEDTLNWLNATPRIREAHLITIKRKWQLEWFSKS